MAERFKQQLVGVYGWVRQQATDNPLGTLLAVVVLVLLAFLIWETDRRDNMGFGTKTFWEWMELLVIPIVLAIGGWWFNKAEKENDRKLAEERIEAEREVAEDRQQEARLQTYFDRMTELLLEKGLLHSKLEDESRSIARTRTLTTLRTLSKTRQAILLHFLHEAGLISREEEVIPLNGVDLSGADLSEADLRWADLIGVVLSRSALSGAHLSETDLSDADLSGADLTKADLRRTILIGANLSGANLTSAHLVTADLGTADLTGADMRGAYLRGADLRGADLSGVNLIRAILTGADLTGANLTGAKLTGDDPFLDNLLEDDMSWRILSETGLSQGDLLRDDLTGAVVSVVQLAQARSLKGATMPDGTKHEEWVKSHPEFLARWGETAAAGEEE